MPKTVFAILSLIFFAQFCCACDKQQPEANDEHAAIRELHKTGAQIEIDDQGHAVSLMWLAVTDSKFTDTDLIHIVALPHLKELWLEQTSVTDSGLHNLKTMKQLETLALICEYIPGKRTTITNSGLKHLQGLTNLRILHLDDSDVTDCGLVHLQGLTKLEVLSLFGTEISEDGLKHLRGLKNLTYLDLAETQWEKKRGAIKFDAVKALRKHLPDCKIDY